MPSISLPTHVPITVAFRGGHPENIHHGSLAVVNTQGELLASVGDVHAALFTRSALKPFQAMPLIAHAANRLRLDDADVALLCASHSGEPMHVERAASLLARIGASEAALECGTHVPYFYGATGTKPAPGTRFSRLHHNCSGKHTGMLLLADALGAPLSDHLDPSHPVQRQIAQSVVHFTGVPTAELVLGTDGVQALASFSRGIGIAAKVSDGQLAPLMVAFVSALEQLGWLDVQSRAELASLIPPPLKNAAGIEVGEMRAVLEL